MQQASGHAFFVLCIPGDHDSFCSCKTLREFSHVREKNVSIIPMNGNILRFPDLHWLETLFTGFLSRVSQRLNRSDAES